LDNSRTVPANPIIYLHPKNIEIQIITNKKMPQFWVINP
jgi:hypothetical protein